MIDGVNKLQTWETRHQLRSDMAPSHLSGLLGLLNCFSTPLAQWIAPLRISIVARTYAEDGAIVLCSQSDDDCDLESQYTCSHNRCTLHSLWTNGLTIPQLVITSAFFLPFSGLPSLTPSHYL